MIINIPLSKAYKLLQKTEAIIVSVNFIEEKPLVYPTLSKLTGKPNNQFLCAYYLGDDDYEFVECFQEKNNLNPQIDTLTNELILIDDTDKEVRLSLLTIMKL